MKWLLHRSIRKFERHFGYDAGYMHHITDLDSMAGFRLGMTSDFLRSRFGADPRMVAAAKLTSVTDADCGPCLRLAAQTAREAGLSAGEIAAILDGETGDPGMDLAIAYARAVAGKAPEAIELGEEVRRKHGDHTLAALAVAVVAGQFYPMLKRGLGEAQACENVLASLRGAEAKPMRIAEANG